MAKNANPSIMAMTLRVVVPPHPLIAHWLTVLRSVSTPSPLYATGLEEIGRWLTYEALREWLPHRQQEIKTSQSKTQGTVVESNVPLLAIPELPGGLFLWQGAKQVMPNAQLCLKGVPNEIERNAGVIVFIDQIASGNRALETLKNLQEKDIESQRIRVVTALTSSPGLKNLGEAFPDLTIHTASIDAELSKNGQIIPGIGDPELRLNTRTVN